MLNIQGKSDSIMMMAAGTADKDPLEARIGVGAILVGKASIRGTATAASLWATGPIGTADGLGAYETAIVLSIATFATLRVMTTFKVEGKDGHADVVASGIREGDDG